MNWAKAQKMTREEVESDLRFMGFIIFENKLKPTTKKVMTELSNAGLRLVMCTGDNVLTALSVARECSLIEPLSHVFVPRFEEGNATLPDSKLVWEGVDNRFFTLNAKTLMVIEYGFALILTFSQTHHLVMSMCHIRQR